MGSLGLWLLRLRMGRRARPASEGTMLGLGQLSWRWLGDSSLSCLTDSRIRGEVREVPERMRHLREDLWSEGSKGDGSWVTISVDSEPGPMETGGGTQR